jgi:mono/diheme cytochrome c family protein
MAPMAGLNKKEKSEVLSFLRSHSQKAEGMLSSAEEQKLFAQKCSLCHTEQRVFLEPLTPKSRRHIVLRMQERAPDWISPKEAERILAYLDQGAPESKKPVKKKVNGGASTIFRERCTACHSLERVYLKLDKKGSAGSAWIHIVKRMREKAPEWISEKEAKKIMKYLATLKPVKKEK